MKPFGTLVILIYLSFCMYNCKKDEISKKYFTDFHDILIKASDGPYESGDASYLIDIDHDNTIDVSINVHAHFSPAYGSDCYIKMTPVIGYEIAFSRCIYNSWSWHPDLADTIFKSDTVNIPKAYFTGNNISINDDFTYDSLMVAYSQDPGGIARPYSSGIYYGMGRNEYIYIAFRKSLETFSRLAWLKVKIPNSYSIILNSCRYIENENILLIE